MALHVDIVKNDWLAGIQYPLATLRVEDSGEVSLDARYPDRWQRLVEGINAQDDVAAALAELATKLHGSHVFATEPHDESECPFHGPPVYLEGEEASGSASTVGAGH
jgi:hypothetical protein